MGWLKEIVDLGKSEIKAAKTVVSDATSKVELVIKLNVITIVATLALIIVIVVLISKAKK